MTMQAKLWRTHHAVCALYSHLVLVTKYLRRVLSAQMLVRIGEIGRDIVGRWEGELHESNGEPDHVHFLLSLPPRVAPSALVNNLKTVSSRLLRKEFPVLRGAYRGKAVLWSPSYCILSAGGAPLEIIKRYIEQQGTHE